MRKPWHTVEEEPGPGRAEIDPVHRAPPDTLEDAGLRVRLRPRGEGVLGPRVVPHVLALPARLGLPRVLGQPGEDRGRIEMEAEGIVGGDPTVGREAAICQRDASRSLARLTIAG